MLKLNSSDSELEFTPKVKVSPSRKGKKKNKSKSKSHSNPDGGGGGGGGIDCPCPAKEESQPILSPKSHPVHGEGILRKQVGSSFENRECSTSSEEESSSSSSSEQGVYGYGRQALGIDSTELENYDGKAEPMNGSQYLMMVMKETKKTPKIAVGCVEGMEKKGLQLSVNYVDKFKMDSSGHEGGDEQIMELTTSNFTATHECRDYNLAQFSLLRSKIDKWRELLLKGVTKLKADSIKLPEVGNKVVWMKFCFGIKFLELVESRKGGFMSLSVNKIVEDYLADLTGPGQHSRGSIVQDNHESGGDGCENPLSPSSITTNDAATSIPEESSSNVSECGGGKDGCLPLMSLMLILTQQQIESLLYFQSDWMTRLGFVNKSQGEWLYALLACIDKPVDPSTMGDIRNICKALITIRNKYCNILRESGILSGDDDDFDKLSDDFQKELSLEEKSHDDISSQAKEYLNALNLFIYLIGDYFCQKDLV